MASFHAWWSLAAIAGALVASIAAATALPLVGFFGLIAVLVIPVGLFASRWFVSSHEANEATPDPLALWPVCMLLGRSVTDRLVVRSGAPKIVVAAGLIVALALALVAVAPSPAPAIAAFAVAGLGISPILPLAFVAASEHDPGDTGIAVARVNVGNYIGFVLGAPLVGCWARSGV